MPAWCVLNSNGSHTCYPYWIVGAIYCPGASVGYYAPTTLNCSGSVLPTPTPAPTPTPPPSPTAPSGSGGTSPYTGSLSSTPSSAAGATAPSASIVPKNPITGPEPEVPQEAPPPEACGPATAFPIPDPTNPVTAIGRYGGDGFGERIKVPTTGASSYLNIYDGEFFYSNPVVTQAVKIKRRGDKLDVYHRATGPGIKAYHAPELQDYHLYGQDDRPGSGWPRNLSENAILIHNQQRSDGNSSYSNAKTILTIGGALLTTVKPSNGAYFDLDFDTGFLLINSTGATGADDTTKGAYFGGGGVVVAATALPPSGSYTGEIRCDSGDGNAMKYWDGLSWVTFGGSGSHPDPHLLGDGSTLAPTYSFTDHSLAGMLYDPDTGQGPALTDDLGVVQMRVTNSGIEIPNKLTVDGLIDPTGLELTAVAANPGGTAANTLWLDSTASDKLKHGSELVIIGAVGSSDGTVPRADGTGTNKLQSSGVIIDDNDNMSGGNSLALAQDTTGNAVIDLQTVLVSAATNPRWRMYQKDGQGNSGTTVNIDFAIAANSGYGVSLFVVIQLNSTYKGGPAVSLHTAHATSEGNIDTNETYTEGLSTLVESSDITQNIVDGVVVSVPSSGTLRVAVTFPADGGGTLTFDVHAFLELMGPMN